MATVDPIATLKADHLQVRDALLELINAINRRDAVKALEILIRLDKLTGPHFRFEEESFYPAVTQFFGPQYHEYLLGVHDRIIRTARQLAETLGTGVISENDAERLAALVRSDVLPHPVECEGLALFAERLTQKELDAIADNLEASQKADVPLLEWSEKVRARKA